MSRRLDVELNETIGLNALGGQEEEQPQVDQSVTRTTPPPSEDHVDDLQLNELTLRGASVERDILELEAKKAELQEEISDLKSRSDSLTSHVDDLREQLESLLEEKDQYQNEIGDFQHQLNEADAHHREVAACITALNSVIQSKETEILEANRLKKQIPELTDYLSTLEATHAQLLEQRAQLEIQLDELRDRKTSVSSRLEELNQTQTQLIRENVELDAQLREKTIQIELLRAEQAKLKALVEVLSDDESEEEVVDLDRTRSQPEGDTAANDETTEEKKSLKQKMYGFMINLLAHPATKASLVVVFTAGLLLLGAALANILSLAAVAAVSVVGLFAGGYTYHRAQAAKAPAPTTTAPEETETEAEQQQQPSAMSA